ncbi:DUF3459 domain-containing protein [Nonomuraea sp. NN258]|uniref:alpha-amylase family glycosyl hydrolase n=1 Tax=Nonomuraea antri TaxID=2730852 RepID=UPI00156804C5|nr:alpha-amylase family glycosyl hydrolase [Nonomuraea antri]NRQ33783.1 DUF3459 domain-containing protein [Nonomuraea antri]
MSVVWRGEQAIWWSVYPLGFTGAPTTAPTTANGAGGMGGHRLRRLSPWLDQVAELGCTGLLLGPIFAAETHGYDTVDHFTIDPRLGDAADFDALVAAAAERGLAVLLDGVFNHVGRSFAGDPRWLRRSAATGELDTFEGHHRLVALDHGQEQVQRYVAAVLNHWLDRGAAGWRLDAAYAVPAWFWRAVLPEVRARHPHAWFVGEVIHGDYAAYVAESGLDSVTQYELWKAIWSSLNDRNLFELAHALGRHDALLDTFAPLTFVGNHDVTRIATRLDDPRHLGHALAVLFTVGGVPSVYYGDELGLAGVKEEREGGDDAIRPAFPPTPEVPPPGREVFALHRRLIALRRRHPWLSRARTEVTHLDNRSAALRTADPAGGAALLTLLNLDDEPYRFPVDPAGADVTESSHPAGVDPATVPGHGWHVLEETR